MLVAAFLCLLLPLCYGSPALAQQQEEGDRKWHFINSVNDVSLPAGCHAELYERPVIADDDALQLLPVDRIHFADVTCIGSSISITGEVGQVPSGNGERHSEDLEVSRVQRQGRSQFPRECRNNRKSSVYRRCLCRSLRP